MQYREFGKFTLLDHMGKGGVASVYRANDNEAGNIVAIKLFEPSDRRPPDMVRKLRDRETRMLISVQHPNVVRYYESGSVGDCYYYTMEFVENSLLKRMRNAEDLSLADKVHILRQTCNALQAIHHQGIVHRDIKPGNVLLDEAPNGAIHVKVTDLGIAKHVSETDIVRDEEASRRVPGTPKYLSPEQIQLKPVDGRADVFSLGVVAYELLSGEAPFKADTSEEYLRANLKQEVRPIHHANAQIPPFISPMLDRMLTKDREARYDSDTLARDLELTYQHLVSGAPLVEEKNQDSIYYVPPVPEGAEARPVEAPVSRRWQYIAAVCMILLGAAAGYLAWPEMPKPPTTGQPVDLTADPYASDAKAVDDAEALMREKQYVRALFILRSRDPMRMSKEDADRWDSLYRQAQNELAPAWGKKGLDALNQGRLTEAEVVRDMMADEKDGFFPNADATAELKKAIDSQRGVIQKAGEWNDTLAAIQDKVKHKAWKDAVADSEKLIRELGGGDAAKEGQLRDVVVSALNGWQDEVLQAPPNRQKITECMEFVEPYFQLDWVKAKARDRRPDLMLHMAHYYARLNMVEDALRWYSDLMAKFPDSEAAKTARTEMDAMRKNAESMPPVDFGPVQRDVATNGFKAAIWGARTPEAGKQEFQKIADATVLRIEQTGGPAERINSLEFMRPVRANVGFDLRVKFMMKPTKTDKTQGCGSGVEVRDKLGNMYALWFNGTNYMVSYRNAKGLGGNFQKVPAFGDEEKTWHELRVRYEYELEKLALFLDDKSMAEYQQVELNLFMVRLFTKITGEGDCKGAFSNVQLDQPD